MIGETTISAKDFAIGVLSVTAVILLATLLMINAFVPRQAYAIPQAGAAGNYVATAARLEETSEMLIILNTQQRLINAYGFNVQTGQVDLIQQIDLEAITKEKEAQRLQQAQGRNPPGPGMMRGPGAGAKPRR